MRALALINSKKENPGSDWVAAEGANWHNKAESYCNVINNNFPVAPQA
jgi:hypothetical protein